MNESPSLTPFAAIDSPRERRPGVPMEARPPHPVGQPHWTTPDAQPDPGTVLKRVGLDALTPVFGTTLPPRGLSGFLRRAAFRIPEHRTSHWLVLLLADRVDVLENDLARVVPITLGVAALGGGAAYLSRRRLGKLRAWLGR
ncbi:MAG: hypothetical protein U0414_06275 [Polyangiaceae bacterium]